MKNGKRPTRKEKLVIEGYKLNPENWLITKRLPRQLYLVHRISGKERVIPA